MNKLPCDAAGLIPHEPPMLLLNRLIEKAEDDNEKSMTVIEAITPASGPFVEDAQLLPEYFIEVMAQSIAAHDGYPLVEGTTPATGLLTGIEDFSWIGTAKPGESITIRVRKTFEFGSAFIFEGTIQGPSGEIARGQLKIWKLEE